MDWDALHTFLAVAETGSLRAAGAQLRLDPSTVSRRLQALETSLGAVLAERRRDGMELTAAGEELAAAARAMRARLAEAERRIAGRDERLEGRVTLSTSPVLALIVVAPALVALRREHPRIDVDVTVSDRLVSVHAGEAELVVRATQSPPDTLVGRHLGPVRMADCGPPHAARLSRLDADPAGALRSDSTLLLARLVGLGIGRARLPLALARSSGVADVRPDAEPRGDEWSLWVLRHPQLGGSGRVRAVQSALTAAAAEVVWSR